MKDENRALIEQFAIERDAYKKRISALEAIVSIYRKALNFYVDSGHGDIAKEALAQESKVSHKSHQHKPPRP